MSDGTGDGDGFGRRWSRLKQASREEERVREPEAAVPVDDGSDNGNELALNEPEAAAADATDARETREITEEDLPDIDGLDAESDFTPFMQAGVPENLQRLALRKLWNSNPVLANIDGLNDYDEDFKAAMDIGIAYIDKARAAGAKFIGEHKDDPEEAETGDLAEIEAEPQESGEQLASAGIEDENISPELQEEETDSPGEGEEEI